MDQESLTHYMAIENKTDEPTPPVGKDDVATAMARVNTALTNLIKMRLKVVQTVHSTPKNADHKRFIEQKVQPREKEVDGMVSDYEFLVKNKVIKDHPGPTTPSHIKTKLCEDSKKCSAIAATLAVAASYED